MRTATLLAGAFASAAALWLPPAAAGTFTISPLRVDLSTQTTTAALTVRNEDKTSVVVQAEALRWAQAGGDDALEPTRDLLVSPAVFTLPPNGSQLVRVALRREADPRRELSYRVWLQEVPQPADPGFTGLKVALRLSLPVFVTPAVPVQPLLEWSASRAEDGKLVVRADNHGEAHERVLGFSVVRADGSGTMLQQGVATYVLPGQHRAWTLDHDGRKSADPGDAAKTYRLSGVTERGRFAAEITAVP